MAVVTARATCQVLQTPFVVEAGTRCRQRGGPPCGRQADPLLRAKVRTRMTAEFLLEAAALCRYSYRSMRDWPPNKPRSLKVIR